jgi:crossover junction endodeoxyribonuclease RuvC
LLAVSRGILELIAEFSPQAVAVERVFAQHNLRTVMGTAQASGIALAAAAEHGLPVGLHTQSEVASATPCR